MIADAGFGALFGTVLSAPGAYGDARAQQFYEAEAAASDYENAPEAPQTPAQAETPVEAPTPAPEELAGPATPEALAGRYSTDEISTAQEALFGEVIGTKNLTPEQLNAVDDYIAAGKPGDIPQGKVETEGSSTNDPGWVGTAEDGRRIWKRPDGSEVLVDANGKADFTNTKAPAPLPIGREYRLFNPSELKVDAKRFQFKDGGNDAGVTDRLKGVKKWDQTKSGVTLVWEDTEGNFFIADGHQRHGLATRLEADGQQPKIMAVVLREKDGISSEDARAIAAAKNIAEGTGNAVDAAKILRSRPDMGVDLPPTSALVRDAQGLASLSDDAFGMVINKKVPAGYAAIVGRIVDDERVHGQILDLLAKQEPASAVEAESMIRDVMDAPTVQATMEDMFGSSEVTQILFKERAQVLSSAATALRKDRAAFNILVKEEARITGAGNTLNTKANLERANTDAEIIATLQATARRKGPVADALAAAAKQLADGAPRQVVVRDFLDTIRGSDAAANPDGGGAGPTRRSEQIAARLGGYRNTDTTAFKKWFSGSKVLDEDGNPLPVYHGTAAGGFDTFDTYASNYGLMGQGGYFTENPTVAAEYTTKGAARMQREGREPMPTVYIVYTTFKTRSIWVPSLTPPDGPMPTRIM